MDPIRYREMRVHGITSTGEPSNTEDAIVLVVAIDPGCPLGAMLAKDGTRHMIFGDIGALVRSENHRRAADVIRNSCLAGPLDTGKMHLGLFKMMGWTVMMDLCNITPLHVPFVEVQGSGRQERRVVTTRLNTEAMGTLIKIAPHKEQIERAVEEHYRAARKVIAELREQPTDAYNRARHLYDEKLSTAAKDKKGGGEDAGC